MTLLVGGFATYAIYLTAVDEEAQRLQETAQSQARFIESVARFNARYSQDYAGGASMATLAQIRDAHARYHGFGETGEFTLGKREGDKIVFLLSHRHYDLANLKPIPFNASFAEPMRRALQGVSGTLIGLDYRGQQVLAAHEPVAFQDLGVVAKIDLAEIRTPFIRTFLWTCLIGTVSVAIGAFLFIGVTGPWVEAIQAGESRYRGVFDQAAVGIGRIAPDGSWLEVNQKLCDIVGYPREELLRWSFHDISYPDDLEDNLKLVRQVLEGDRTSYRMEKRFLNKSCEIVWSVLTVSLVRNPHGEPEYFIAVVEDISDRKRAEAALSESERFINRALDSSLAGIYIYDLERGQVDYVNSRFTVLTGYGFEEINQLSPEQYAALYHPDDSERLLAHVQEIHEAADEEVIGIEYRFRARDGRWIWCLSRDTVFERDAKGKVRRFIGTFLDVTESKQAEVALQKSEEKYRLAVDATQDGLWDWNIVTGEVTFSPAWGRLLDLHALPNEYSSWVKRIHPQDKTMVLKSMQAHLDGETDQWKAEHRLQGANGDWKWVLGRGRVVTRAQDETPLRMVGTMTDISAAKEAEGRLRQAEEQFLLLLNSAAEGIYGIDTQGNCIFANTACLKMLGYQRQEQVVGQNMHNLIHHTKPDGMHNPLEECQIYRSIHDNEGTHVSNELFWRKDGSGFPVEYWSYPMRKNGVVTGSVVTFLDITERKQLEAELKHMASHDALTGLYNRKALERKIDEEMQRSKRYQHPMSVFLLDIDHFKKINDTHGHTAGDLVLKTFARRLRHSIRSIDYAARYGGEEFVLVLPETSLDDARELAERLRHAIANVPVSIDTDQGIRVTTSIGVATYPIHGSTWEELVSAADAAMYRAKNAGRNLVEVAA